MPFSYVGNFPNQKIKNSGIFSPEDVLNLSSVGEYGGSLEFIAQETYSSSVSTVDFLNIKENKFDVHVLEIISLKISPTNSGVRVQMYENGVLESGTVYHGARQVCGVSGTFLEQKDTTYSGIVVGGSTTTATGHNTMAYIYLYNLGNSSKYSFSNIHDMTFDYYEAGVSNFGLFVLPQASSVNGLRVTTTSGNFTDFDIKLYGVKKI
jgi:hypothetical protein|tara:strand:+ start:210 stop:833 length:624 start_codon:yes stop_codon:yes gene_type:complete